MNECLHVTYLGKGITKEQIHLPDRGQGACFSRGQKAAARAFTLYCKALTVQYCEKQTDFPNTELLTTESKSFLTGKQLGEGISYKSAVKIMGMQSSFLWLWPSFSCEVSQADIPRNVFLSFPHL